MTTPSTPSIVAVDDGTTRVCDGAHESSILGLAFSPDTRWLVSISKTEAMVWSVETGTLHAKLPGAETGAVAITNGPECMAYAQNSEICLRSVRTQSHGWLRGHANSVSNLQFSPDGAKLASADFDGVVRIWDVAANLAADPEFAVVRAGAALAWCSNSGSHVFEMDSSTLRVTPSDPNDQPTELQFLATQWRALGRMVWSADGRTVAGLFESTGQVELHTCQFGNGPETRKLLTLEYRSNEASRLARPRLTLAANGQKAAAAVGGAIRVVDLAQGSVHELPDSNGCGVLAMSADAALVAASSVSPAEFTTTRVRVWRTSLSTAPVLDVQHRELAMGASAVTFAPNNQILAVATVGPNLGKLSLWDLTSGQLLLERIAHETEISCIHFDAGGSRLLTGAVDGSIRIWDLDTGSLMLDLTGHTQPITALGSSLADGRLVSCDASGEVRFWPPTGADLIRLAPLRRSR